MRTSVPGPARVGTAASLGLHLLAFGWLAAHPLLRPAPPPAAPLLVTWRAEPRPIESASLPTAAPAHERAAPQPALRARAAKPAPMAAERQAVPAPAIAQEEQPARAAAEPAPAERREAPTQPASAAEPPRLTPPAFDAAYLQNPAPTYPPLSRRLHEQGKVVLRVLVSPAGAAAEVLVQATSGSARLDGSALEAVKRWKFSPARRGAEPVAAWVLVPISFNLEG